MYGPGANRPSDAEGWPQARPSFLSAAKKTKGRANSEPCSVAPQGEAAAEAPKKKTIKEANN
ncbi:hypothetical protein SGRA_2380 [Saprospira grandis str. Lewin]|uniref:Uncharacterized protein n=1 Tax=Saprospira grandis (strain Lewin) TaxID=984262 RepID=H6L4T4_SAPGL|nr:hypothetical protein SGRA_2380 [Saprospira grandis str. Lewin]